MTARTPIEIVAAWFECFANGDLAAARELFDDDGVVRVFGEYAAEIHGFDQFIAWFGRRRQSLGESFDYRADELLAGNRHAAALITLSRTIAGRRVEWRQLAVDRVEDDRITAVHAYEEPQHGSGSWSDC